MGLNGASEGNGGGARDRISVIEGVRRVVGEESENKLEDLSALCMNQSGFPGFEDGNAFLDGGAWDEPSATKACVDAVEVGTEDSDGREGVRYDLSGGEVVMI